MERDHVIDMAVKEGFQPRQLVDHMPDVPVKARVLQVDENYEIVILNVGKKDKVHKGMEFILSRGSTYVGAVRVRNVYQDMCSATFVLDVMKGVPQVSDFAQTRN